MRGGRPLLVSGLIVSLVACGSDDPPEANVTDGTSAGTAGDPSPPPTTSSGAPPTTCLGGDSETMTTIKITIDDPSDGFGSVGTRVPSDVAAGTIRVDVESHEDNRDPIDVPILEGDTEVFRFVGVAPGTTCGAEVDFAAGTYRVPFGENEAEFTIDG
jgi:hypothetical protein